MLLNMPAGMSLLFVAIAWVNTPANGAEANIDHDVCRTESTKVVLCFDLRDDGHPTAGIILNLDVPDGRQHRLFVPFTTSASERDKSLLTTWGTYDDFTLVSFDSVTPGMHVLGIAPVFDGDQDSTDDRRSRSALSFVRSGLERHFVYRHAELSARADIPPGAKHLETDTFDLVGVARPKASTGLEVANGRIEDPAAILDNGRARFYQLKDAGGKPSRIELRYQVPATSWQALLLANLAKLAGALAGPFIAILFFTVKENVHPRTRRIMLLLLALLQTAILVFLIYLARRAGGDSAPAAIADWMIVLLTALATALPLWLKREPKTPGLAVRP